MAGSPAYTILAQEEEERKRGREEERKRGREEERKREGARDTHLSDQHSAC